VPAPPHLVVAKAASQVAPPTCEAASLAARAATVAAPPDPVAAPRESAANSTAHPIGEEDGRPWDLT